MLPPPVTLSASALSEQKKTIAALSETFLTGLLPAEQQFSLIHRASSAQRSPRVGSKRRSNPWTAPAKGSWRLGPSRSTTRATIQTHHNLVWLQKRWPR